MASRRDRELFSEAAVAEWGEVPVSLVGRVMRDGPAKVQKWLAERVHAFVMSRPPQGIHQTLILVEPKSKLHMSLGHGHPCMRVVLTKDAPSPVSTEEFLGGLWKAVSLPHSLGPVVVHRTHLRANDAAIEAWYDSLRKSLAKVFDGSHTTPDQIRLDLFLAMADCPTKNESIAKFFFELVQLADRPADFPKSQAELRRLFQTKAALPAGAWTKSTYVSEEGQESADWLEVRPGIFFQKSLYDRREEWWAKLPTSLFVRLLPQSAAAAAAAAPPAASSAPPAASSAPPPEVGPSPMSANAALVAVNRAKVGLLRLTPAQQAVRQRLEFTDDADSESEPQELVPTRVASKAKRHKIEEPEPEPEPESEEESEPSDASEVEEVPSDESEPEPEPEPSGASPKQRRHLLVDRDVSGLHIDLPVPHALGGTEDEEPEEKRFIDCLVMMKLAPPAHVPKWAKTGREADIVEYYDRKIAAFNPRSAWPRMKLAYFGEVSLIFLHALLLPQASKRGSMTASSVVEAREAFYASVLGKPEVLSKQLRQRRSDVRACLARMRCLQNKKDHTMDEDEGYYEPWAHGVAGGAANPELATLLLKDGVVHVKMTQPDGTVKEVPF
jgi:hypothetical protein